jgi:phage baseplate assembly protein W
MNGQQPDSVKAFLGVGWAFPTRLDADRRISLAAYEQDIEQSIRIILGTNRGERVMRPDFGAGLIEFVFEPANTATMELLRRRVEESLIDWEPRIDVEEVKVTIQPNERNRLDIDISYRVRATNTLHNLVYPFYLQEGAAR